ncbi:YihY/virulence factor BrkB family protein [Blastococcus sp. TBT05-19]|uniref:YihY/virulence factor BrkB family protein n=1 Tax=Blastococcus sp. TBT05-19 TaxID=2250581 RepID=UPI000DEA7198|nr:YihY/virulence factor BrkB family protein [Blastococcus sp. TBT05-19]RBY90312.1 YihY/virulence factor BrkB family protein [Blastococcus sp. TBT05-19]
MPDAPGPAPTRSHATGPGWDATAPHHIPLRGWVQILRRAGRQVLGDRLQVLSAGIAFFALLSLAPMLIAALSVYGALNSPEAALRQLSDVTGLLPDDLEPVVGEQLATITQAAGVVSTRSLVGLLVSLWTATTAATWLVDALTLAYLQHDTRGWLRRASIGLGVVVGGALLVGGALSVSGYVDGLLAGAPGPVRATGRLLGWPVLAALIATALSVLYRFVPDRTGARWRWISGGAALATLLWLGATAVLFAYVETLGGYRSTYGSLAGVAVSMFWLWLTVFLVIVGAAINAETERQTARDSTVGPERPLGQRGAVVADSAPPYPEDG